MMIRVLEIVPVAATSYADKGGETDIRSERVSYDRALDVIHGHSSVEGIFDAIVLRLASLPNTGERDSSSRMALSWPAKFGFLRVIGWSSVHILHIACAARLAIGEHLARSRGSRAWASRNRVTVLRPRGFGPN
jgi:hypothetical protein